MSRCSNTIEMTCLQVKLNDIELYEFSKAYVLIVCVGIYHYMCLFCAELSVLGEKLQVLLVIKN